MSFTARISTATKGTVMLSEAKHLLLPVSSSAKSRLLVPITASSSSRDRHFATLGMTCSRSSRGAKRGGRDGWCFYPQLGRCEKVRLAQTFEVCEAGNSSRRRTPEGVRQPTDARSFHTCSCRRLGHVARCGRLNSSTNCLSGWRTHGCLLPCVRSSSVA